MHASWLLVLAAVLCALSMLGEAKVTPIHGDGLPPLCAIGLRTLRSKVGDPLADKLTAVVKTMSFVDAAVVCSLSDSWDGIDPEPYCEHFAAGLEPDELARLKAVAADFHIRIAHCFEDVGKLGQTAKLSPAIRESGLVSHCVGRKPKPGLSAAEQIRQCSRPATK